MTIKEASVTIKLTETELDTMIATITLLRDFAALKLVPNKDLLSDLKRIKKDMNKRRPKNIADSSPALSAGA
tara:strand:- start:783 stop:998 length:216 start_codon:yes stop_codon:yes gene_type:complete